jgi:hypothetical protein
MPIFVFPLALEIRLEPNQPYNNPELQGLGFSGIYDFEAQLPQLIPLATSYGFGRFFTYYSSKGLVVATSRPHYDDENNAYWQFKRTWFRNENRYLTRNEILENCPSLSKFNGCQTCQFHLGSLPCFSKSLTTTLKPSNSSDSNFLRYDDLPKHIHHRYDSRAIRRTQPVQGQPNMFWVPTAHLDQHRRSRRVPYGVSHISMPDIIEQRIRAASAAAQEGHKTRKKLEHCGGCYFVPYCTKRWLISQCGGPYTKEDILERAMSKVRAVCQRRELSLEELKFFINVGGHKVYPQGFPLIFRGLSDDFHQAMFHSKRGGYFCHVNFDVAKTWFKARYWYRDQYTRNTDHIFQHEITDEMLGAYLELCAYHRFKTSDGWTQHSSIDSICADSAGLRISFFSHNCDRFVRSYATLFNKLPRLLSTINW